MHLYKIFIKFHTIILTLCLIAACQTNISDADLSQQEITSDHSNINAGELLQTDANRMTTIAMRNNLHSLYVLLEKLYKRNPKEWRKTANSLDEANKIVFDAILNDKPFGGLNNNNGIEAFYIALDPTYKGDRAGALIYATATMIIVAHGGHSKFYISDVVNPTYVFNAARNIEVAQWLLKQRKDNNGNPLLLSNEISVTDYNISFAIEFAKVVARLDLVSSILDERTRRVGTNYIHGLLFLTFLPVQ